ncbi:hypothetical protein [Bdellovibrio reynosensis]|uniref:Secreted protein n=1 Tax=Bdellovibrio reynosensis TaxID=2835041 RepID=A0ABY4CD13_9BACT|nr:hypothetical protein [Bdellovibrio reynosensis]UOF02674.1 hypothetical protein MNR06_06890 [Bdellovibrio reynosensis]
MMKPCVFRDIKIVTSALFVAALVGCIQGQDGTSASTAQNTNSQFSATSNKVYFDDATVDQLIPHKVACPAEELDSEREKICIQVCHIPSGDMEKAHNKVLPLGATYAHIGHGDFLGLCDGTTDQAPVDETPVEETPAVDETPVEETPIDETPVTDGEEGIPMFCQPYYEIDRDCDGFNDETGSPYL